MAKIEIEKCDEMYDEECKGPAFMPFHRAYYDGARVIPQLPSGAAEPYDKLDRWELCVLHEGGLGQQHAKL
ncbi:Dual oxidase-like [Caligus rogercresseyi]|uniref:Dual oxidase-like n=1 Tax=Caligus rogercresseyi TaxID=217165 RepID=A0A7T8GMA5_CALRO|nr:Dual oxidase-like [Caligus rogercresseyi]